MEQGETKACIPIGCSESKQSITPPETLCRLLQLPLCTCVCAALIRTRLRPDGNTSVFQAPSWPALARRKSEWLKCGTIWRSVPQPAVPQQAIEQVQPDVVGRGAAPVRALPRLVHVPQRHL
jgi:hypothetical protein